MNFFKVFILISGEKVGKKNINKQFIIYLKNKLFI